jgi:alpha-N-arabinofuranosidase
MTQPMPGKHRTQGAARHMLRALCILAPLFASAATAAPVAMVVRADASGPVIDRHIFGQFAEHLGFGIYGGIWVGENSPIPNTHGYRNDVLAALKALAIPVIRWPGGCFADRYHWRDGIGPRAKRPVRINTIWGGVEEPNSFGTHEFMDLTEMLGADAYISGNLGTGSPRELADWIEYMTSTTHSSLANERRKNGRAAPWNVAYVAVGNESWGCGGNMRPEYYADLYRQYESFIADPPGKPIYKVASGANAFDTNYTDVVMSRAADRMNGISVHYYTLPSGSWDTPSKGSATAFGEDQYISTIAGALKMDDLISRHAAVMDKYDPKKRVGLIVDEWGVWTDVEPGTNPAFLHQQDSLRNALFAAVNLDIFMRHADRVKMANIAQMVNVLQPMILTDGPRMVRTPTYYVFQMYRPFQDAVFVPVDLQAPSYSFGGVSVPALEAAAGRDAKGVLHIALVNLDPHNAIEISARLQGVHAGKVGGLLLSAPAVNSVNSFAAPQTVIPAAFDAARLEDGTVSATLPAKSLVVLSVE